MRPPALIPGPPQELLDRSSFGRGGGRFAPALDLEAWVAGELLAENRPLSNYDHAHLAEGEARIGFLWSTERFLSKGRRVLGTAQTGEPTGKAWSAGRQRQQLAEWFGTVPDFLVTLDAWHASTSLDERRPQDFLAVLEHELYHCAQDKTADGDLRFDRDGRPIWGIRPHDIEEFAGVVRRYGHEARPDVARFVEAVDHAREHGPAVAPADLDGLCGTCRSQIQSTQ